MIPLRDTIRSRNYPVVNTSIIVLNALVFFLTLGQTHERFFFIYGLVPARYSVPEIASYFTFGHQVLSFFSFMFLHGGFWHLAGNMWSLYIFGDNVEDRLGSVRYLLFYLLCGIASGLSHLVINWHSQIPTIGASGAIAGVMGAYILLYPRSRILTLIPIFFIPYLVELPAFVFLGIWFLFQFISAAGTPSEGAGIAWWAHIGGFIFGMVFLKIFLKIPQLGVSAPLRQKTARQKTPRLQVVRTEGSADDGNLYGSLTVTPKEARLGTSKLINIPWGYQKRLFRVTIPPGVRHGSNLRLVGLGKAMDSQKRGDLLLNVMIREEET